MLTGGTTSVLVLPNPAAWPELLSRMPRSSAAIHVCRCLATGCPSPQHRSRSHASCFPLYACSSLLGAAQMLSFAWIGLFIATIN